MTYINPLDPTAADAGMQATLAQIKQRVGQVPNLYATLAKSPAALDALLQINQSIIAGALSAKEREIVALATSQANGCEYCLSAHTLLGQQAGLSVTETRLARAGNGSTARAAALAAFAKKLVEEHGHVDEAELDRFKASGLIESDLLEVIANVAATTLTNLVNNVARTEIDFPVVSLKLAV